MQAGNELLRVADQLCAELGYAAGGAEAPGASSAVDDKWGMKGILSSEDEALVLKMRAGLTRIAAAAGGARPEGMPEGAIGTVLDGAEMVMRGELMRGNSAQLPTLMPSFVFLVALVVVDQDRALELSERTVELIEGAPG